MSEDKTVTLNDLPSLNATLGERWLGNMKLISSLLRYFAFKSLQDAQNDDFAERIDSNARNLAKIFLGQDKKYPGPAWFSPGQIDVYLARVEGIQSEEPEERVAGALLNMISDVLAIARSSTEKNLLGEQWQWQCDATIDSYARKIAGLPDGDDDNTNEKDKTSDLPPSKTPPQVKPSPFVARK